jgi:hypothetical protein
MLNRFPFFLCIAILISACGNLSEEKAALPGSSGKYGEVLVVVDTAFENQQTGEMLDTIFFQSLPALPQQEPHFRMATVDQGNFKSILKRSRNILKLDIGQEKKSKIRISRDVWAKDQLVISITAADDEAAARILKKNRQTIRDYFNEEELNRLQAQYRIKREGNIEKMLKGKLQIEAVIPPGFVQMKDTEKAVWIKKEKYVGQHQVIQGIMFYEEAYEGDSLFHENRIISLRNELAKDLLQGVREDSYMKVYEELTLVEKEINWEQAYAKEYRGLWNMENDFMGGPFIHYTIYDKELDRLIHLDGFVYAPKFNKREYLRELEAILKTVEV